MYFNKKYKREGSLFQGIFKAIDIEEDNYLLWVSRYIHRNPDNFKTYPYSSYEDYIGERRTEWVHADHILDYLSKNALRKIRNYQQFVSESTNDGVDLSPILLEGDGPKK